MLPVFITVVLVLMTITIFFSGPIGDLFQQKFNLNIRIRETGGLRVGAPVWMQGLTVGSVTAMDFHGDRIVIQISIGNKYRSYLYRDARAEVKAIGLLGSKYVELFRGTETSGNIKPGQSVEGILVDPLRNIDENFNTTIKQLSALFDRIISGEGTTATLVNDSAMANDVKSTVNNFNMLLEEIRKDPKKFFRVEIF
jgi:phospholipid/cholesterol/gamma-HCH transport system substrate-binding protein